MDGSLSQPAEFGSMKSNYGCFRLCVAVKYRGMRVKTGSRMLQYLVMLEHRHSRANPYLYL